MMLFSCFSFSTPPVVPPHRPPAAPIIITDFDVSITILKIVPRLKLMAGPRQIPAHIRTFLIVLILLRCYKRSPFFSFESSNSAPQKGQNSFLPAKNKIPRNFPQNGHRCVRIPIMIPGSRNTSPSSSSGCSQYPRLSHPLCASRMIPISKSTVLTQYPIFCFLSFIPASFYFPNTAVSSAIMERDARSPQ